ncbi:hypothetical protein V6N13_029920 [Hibiscus sabdariffa]
MDWDWAKLETLLLHSVLLHLSATKPPRLGFTRDIPGWSQSHNQAFTVRSAYKLLGDSNSLISNGVWKAFAGFRGLQRIKLFIWFLDKGRLLTNAGRVRYHLAISARCGACGAVVEMTHHLFRECPMAVAVWGGLIRHDSWVEFLSMDVLACIRLNLVSSTFFTIDSTNWDLRFGVILWSL